MRGLGGAGGGEGVGREKFGGLEEGFDLKEGRFGACGLLDLLEEAKGMVGSMG